MLIRLFWREKSDDATEINLGAFSPNHKVQRYFSLDVVETERALIFENLSSKVELHAIWRHSFLILY
jgi:hypothetical protein